MERVFTYRIDIDAPRIAVFGLLANVASLHEVLIGWKPALGVAPGPVAEGDVWQVPHVLGDETHLVEYEAVVVDSPAAMEWANTSLYGHAFVTWTIGEVNGGAHLHLEVRLVLPDGPAAAAWAAAYDQTTQDNLQRIKEAVEH